MRRQEKDVEKCISNDRDGPNWQSGGETEIKGKDVVRRESDVLSIGCFPPEAPLPP